MAGTDRFLDGILERNRAFVRGREPRPLPPVETPPLAVVACYDPRLDELVLPSIGLVPGGAFLLRTAGAVVPPEGDPMRSLAMSIFLFGVREILVVGHSSCRMATFSAAAFAEAFRARGVPRDAFGTQDLRQWAGAIRDPRSGVLTSVGHVLDAPFLPRDVAVAGAVLDDTTGELEVVVRPGERPETGLALGPPAVETPSVAVPGEPPFLEPAAAEEREADPLTLAVRRLVNEVGTRPALRAEIERLRRDMAARSNPLAKFGVLEAFLRRASEESHEIRAAYDDVKREAGNARRRFDPADLIQLFGRLARKDS